MIDGPVVKIEETGQKNIVLTLYELIEGETTSSQGMISWTTLYKVDIADFPRRIPRHGPRSSAEIT